ncbi:maltose acetyltransferase domain-containing protein [Bifidobacterium santillanense]|uniref:maltose acetyltransferase domain-containing protein n=1 Tax=Bifidobacterium santillanense TaxID=2809028 RepID=UPI0023E8697B|nr:maltose acetyltransferase domain-containing protein [Bifidobacterium santillanense]
MTNQTNTPSDAAGTDDDPFRVPPVELRTPRRSEREEMLDGKLYDVSDPELVALRDRSADLCTRFNATSRADRAARAEILDELLPGHGESLDVLGPVFFDYGCHTTIGDRVFANFNFTVLDCAPVTIGDDVLFGPNVSLLPRCTRCAGRTATRASARTAPPTTTNTAARSTSARTAGSAAT